MGHLKDSQLKLRFLQKQLQELVISGVGGLKVSKEPVKVAYKPPENENEAERKARVRRRWRVLGMKIKFGLGAQSLATKKRNLADASTFIEKESEEASKEDQLDLEANASERKQTKDISEE